MDDPPPPLDLMPASSGRHGDAGDHLQVEVMTAAEALDQQASVEERGFAHGINISDDEPDEMHVADDGRSIAVCYSADARRQLSDS